MAQHPEDEKLVMPASSLSSETFTKADMERWFQEIIAETGEHGWAEPYKFGFGQGMVALRAKMYAELRRRRHGRSDEN